MQFLQSKGDGVFPAVEGAFVMVWGESSVVNWREPPVVRTPAVVGWRAGVIVCDNWVVSGSRVEVSSFVFELERVVTSGAGLAWFVVNGTWAVASEGTRFDV